MGKVAKEIESHLIEKFEPVFIQLDNESHMHNVPENSETHFKLLLVANCFSGMMRVQRQQAVYQAVDTWLKGPVHALSMRVLTEEEWKKDSSFPDSPNCLGGDRT